MIAQQHITRRALAISRRLLNSLDSERSRSIRCLHFDWSGIIFGSLRGLSLGSLSARCVDERWARVECPKRMEINCFLLN